MTLIFDMAEGLDSGEALMAKWLKISVHELERYSIDEYFTARELYLQYIDDMREQALKNKK